ncbi:hypothetical protein [Hoylesella shahii]|uniref:Uncharacterized protein n=1 Tax=Hoylesella shahii DSM 15611 = JCM 12083 TaxID=1122991 RepID=A0A318IG78_9BACT|nr:hypothetical protein [Hoylesella shahii]PXX23641.1 hypothetical protein EJ73_00630 [Hoylesella shahii DSM 15611 = JCM 12083]
MRQKVINEFNNTASLFYIVIGGINDIASRAIVDAIAELKKSKYYKAEVKAGAEYSMKKFYDYENKLKQPLSDRFQLYMDVTDEVYSLLYNDMECLRMAFKSELDKHGIKDANLISHIELAHTLIGYSIFSFDCFFKNAMEKYGRNFKNAFLEGRLSKTRDGWEKVHKRFAHSIRDIDFNNSPMCRSAMLVLENKLTSGDLFNCAGARALKINPDCLKDLSQEDIDELKKYE